MRTSRRQSELTETLTCYIIAFTHYLEHEGWVVHTELEDLSENPTLESSLISGPEPEIAFETQLKALGGEHKALILRTSHIGGHKFAGNVNVRLSLIPSFFELIFKFS